MINPMLRRLMDIADGVEDVASFTQKGNNLRQGIPSAGVFYNVVHQDDRFVEFSGCFHDIIEDLLPGERRIGGVTGGDVPVMMDGVKLSHPVEDLV